MRSQLGDPVGVECYAGARRDERPRRILRDGRWESVRVLEQWLSEDVVTRRRLRYFRVAIEPAIVGLLCHDEAHDAWFWRVLS